MNRLPLASAALVLGLAWAAAHAEAGNGRIDPCGPLAADSPAALMAAVAPSGWRAVRADGVVAAELWRARLPGPLQDGAFVGAVRLVVGGQDVRGRTIPAGLYTLRFATLPDGDRHGRCMQNPDFLLLLRAADDVDPGLRLSYHQMTTLSAEIVGRRHPVAWQAKRVGATPAVATFGVDEAGNEILTAPLGGIDAPVTLAILLRGSLSR